MTSESEWKKLDEKLNTFGRVRYRPSVNDEKIQIESLANKLFFGGFQQFGEVYKRVGPLPPVGPNDVIDEETIAKIAESAALLQEAMTHAFCEMGWAIAASYRAQLIALNANPDVALRLGQETSSAFDRCVDAYDRG
jgi:hypothetical protein